MASLRSEVYFTVLGLHLKSLAVAVTPASIKKVLDTMTFQTCTVVPFQMSKHLILSVTGVQAQGYMLIEFPVQSIYTSSQSYFTQHAVISNLTCMDGPATSTCYNS